MEARSQPRRKRENAEDVQPLFLKKCYHMISNADPEIASWSDDGNSFIVKDVQRFASEVIPTIYKHNKFSSFVRQLNFYGFRKIKSNILQDPNWWEFKNQYFRRDDIDAISKIKKSAHFDESSANNEINNLKSHVYDLDSRINTLDHIVEDLSHSIQQMQPFYNQSTTPSITHSYSKSMLSTNGTSGSMKSEISMTYDIVDHTKKRKMIPELSLGQSPTMSLPTFNEVSPHSTLPYVMANGEQYPQGNTDNALSVDEEFFSLDWLNFDEDNTAENPIDGSNIASPTMFSESKYYSDKYIDSSTTSEETDEPAIHYATESNTPSYDITKTMSTPVAPGYLTHSTTTSTQTSPRMATDLTEQQSTHIIQSAEVKDIPSILSLLPSHLQERFVDRLASSLGDQLAKQMNVPTTTTATTTTITPSFTTSVMAQPTTTTTNHNSNVMMYGDMNNTIPSNQMLLDANQSLATAALGALFTTCHLANNTKHMNRNMTTMNTMNIPTVPTVPLNSTFNTNNNTTNYTSSTGIMNSNTYPNPTPAMKNYNSMNNTRMHIDDNNNTIISTHTNNNNITNAVTTNAATNTTPTAELSTGAATDTMMPLSQDMINFMAMNMINSNKSHITSNMMTSNILESSPPAIPVCCSFCASHGG